MTILTAGVVAVAVAAAALALDGGGASDAEQLRQAAQPLVFTAVIEGHVLAWRHDPRGEPPPSRRLLRWVRAAQLLAMASALALAAPAVVNLLG